MTDNHNGHTFISLGRAASNAKLILEAYLRTETEETAPSLEKARNDVIEGDRIQRGNTKINRYVTRSLQNTS